MNIAELVQTMADKRHTTPARMALAWLLAQGPNIVPIPGTKTVARLEENLGAADLSLSPDELDDIRRRLDQITIVGARYPKEQEMLTGR